jgi:hypothetical protein
VSLENSKPPVLDSKSKSFRHEVNDTANPTKIKSNKRRMYGVIFVNVLINLIFKKINQQLSSIKTKNILYYSSNND